jgi:ubiquinone/menaquinone biosynthesis C-methylase UbiE
VGLFRKSAPGEPLGVTMAGVKLGHRLIAVGAGNPTLIAQLATRAGLTGRACLVDADEARLAAGATAVEREGALVEALRAPFGAWPYEAGSFDVAVIADLLPTLDAGSRAGAIVEVYRVLRPGGRALIVEPARRGGIAALLQRQPVDASYTGPTEALQRGGFTAVRVLAEADGVIYAEGIKRA